MASGLQPASLQEQAALGVASTMRPLIEFVFPNRLHRLAYFLRGVATDILAGLFMRSPAQMHPASGCFY